jgi:hypothetical protein
MGPIEEKSVNFWVVFSVEVSSHKNMRTSTALLLLFTITICSATLMPLRTTSKRVRFHFSISFTLYFNAGSWRRKLHHNHVSDWRNLLCNCKWNRLLSCRKCMLLQRSSSLLQFWLQMRLCRFLSWSILFLQRLCN